ncbi:unnamed protein product [Dovyalis caffra]|uniref:Uncharacterized protein n=1 Tax=Dovyalis caffra TaxID=77055 RepID=A0AAV1RMF6_9ROSI|nr:unnamed protein product [Dovyalis caffra]
MESNEEKMDIKKQYSDDSLDSESGKGVNQLCCDKKDAQIREKWPHKCSRSSIETRYCCDVQAFEEDFLASKLIFGSKQRIIKNRKASPFTISEVKIESSEEKMDMLWENFNEEVLLRVSCNSLGNKKQYSDDSLDSEFGKGVNQLWYCCDVQAFEEDFLASKLIFGSKQRIIKNRKASPFTISEVKIESSEEKMDMLWENFNEEVLLRVSCNSLGNKKQYSDDSLDSEFGKGVNQLCCDKKDA